MLIGKSYQRQALRHLSSCCRSLQKASSVLDILRENSPYKDKKKKILILSPEETKDKTLSKFVQRHKYEEAAKSLRRKVSEINGLDFEPAYSPSNIIETMENFKTARSKGSISSDINSTILTLQKSFTKNQLLEYVDGYGKVPSKSKANKTKLSEYIVRHIWNESPAPTDIVFSTKRIPLSHKEMFLLLSQKGSLLRLLRSTVSSLDFDMGKKELILVGTDYQLQNASINLQHKFDNVHAEEFDFTTIQALYERKYGAFTFKDIGKLVEVYFSHLDGNKYELCAFNARQVKRIKRLLVWFLDFNLHTHNYVHMPKDLVGHYLVPYNDIYGMVWKNRSMGHYRLSVQTEARAPTTTLKRELEEFSHDRLKKQYLESDDDRFSQSIPAELAQETYDLLDSLGLSRDDVDEPSSEIEREAEKKTEGEFEKTAGEFEKTAGEFEKTEGETENETEFEKTETEFEKTETEIETQFEKNTETQNETEFDIHNLHESKNSPPSTLIPAETRDKIYQQLSHFAYRSSLHGVSDTNLDSPMFTVTLGHVLFEQDNKMFQVSAPVSQDIAKHYSFNTNVPLVHDRTLSKALAGQEPTNLEVDPHIYSLQFKFLPSPYVGSNADLDENIKYPPIEMWMQVNDNSTPDIESMQVVTVEGENNAYVCLPEKACDMKVTCQLTGHVLPGQEAETSGDSASVESLGIEGVLSAPADKYPRLRDQAGIRQFLQESRLDFSGRKPTSVASAMSVEIGGKSIEYSFVSMNYRRELLVEVEENKIAQLSTVDGGSLGGRRVEVRFVGDYSSGLSRESFEKLLDYSCRFVNDL